MTTHSNGGPAFPCRLINTTDEPIEGMCGEVLPPKTIAVYPGINLRDYFAAKAMQAYFTDPDVGFGSDVLEAGARAAYRIADAMLEARETP